MAKPRQVKIDVQGDLPTVPLERLEGLQGELKSLSEERYEKLKKSILDRGFFVPVFVWHDAKNARVRLVDGHQRIRVLTKLREEGYTIPEIPTVAISAKNEKEAREKLLAIVSQYGEVDRQGLYEFLHESGFDGELLITDFQIPDINAQKFMDEFYNDDSLNIPEPPENALPGDLRSVGGNGVKMLQLFYTEEQHQKVLGLIAKLQGVYDTKNATDTVTKALENEVARAAR